MDDSSGVLTKYQNGLGIDSKLKLSSNGVSKYFLADHLGSTNALTDSSGTILEQTAYDSFGNATNQLSTRYAFTGREFDNFTGLHYYRARWYDGNLGRFISEDPIGFAGGDVNLYGYVHNNSINKNDPWGLVDLGYGSPTGPPIPYSNLERSAVTSYPFSYDFGCDRSGIGVGAINDFTKNYSDMRAANTIGADKFFHCMANCQAARRGSIGVLISQTMSEGRELFDENLKGDPRVACDADRYANQIGRDSGSRCDPCVSVCSRFVPQGLTYPVPRPNFGPNGDCGRFGNWGCK
ncbi:MAG: hypothetical protein IPN69_20780 [Acidobacteria bacterium]|nr:hypothetical protein [Acidobacteriota bacterium]